MSAHDDARIEAVMSAITCAPCIDCVREALAAADACDAAHGIVRVPMEPTDAMIDGAIKTTSRVAYWRVAFIYRAMIAAALSAAQQQGDAP